MTAQEPAGEVAVRVENIGGIESTEVTLPPGVTVLSGRNATNRTSFLRAVMGALGSESLSVKTDADRGRVELELDGERYVRTVTRDGGQQLVGGDPYLEDPTVAELFAFLLRSNPARQAIIQRADLREVIMEPVDTEGIREEIRRLEQRRRELDGDLEELDSIDDRRPTLEQRRAELSESIEATRAELAATEEAIADSVDRDDDASPALEDLRESREALQGVRRRIDAERESIQALRDDREDLRASLDELGGAGTSDPEELEAEIDRCRERKRALESRVTRLQRLLQFNRQVLEDGQHPFGATEGPTGDGSPTDRLVAAETELVCWTCGNPAERDDFEACQADLRAVIDEQRAEQSEVEDRLSSLLDRQEAIENERAERERLESRLEEIETELETRIARLEDLEAERDDAESTVEALEAAVSDTDTPDREALVDLHREAADLEVELDRLQRELAEVEDQLGSVEADLARRDRLEEEWEQVQSELLAARDRIEEIETAATEAFNDEMATVLARLEYDNIARIWIERRTTDRREAARFELNVAREADGVTYEDTLVHLSESEREVTGLVFALAGYLVHDVHEEVPFILLDSLEAIDAGRIARLVDYFSGYVRYLVVALLPEDAAALDDGHHRIESL